MGTYSIKELERLSGIKAHTIRIWENVIRSLLHSVLQPTFRLYTDEDLKRIINVSLLNNHGVKISKIARMSEPEIRSKILELNESKQDADLYIDQLVVAMVEMDEEGFEDIISELVRKFGLETCITGAIYPFLEKIGVLWQTGSITPAHEHFISNLIRQRLIFSIASLPVKSKRSIKAILFLPEGELHELGLLFFHYIARSRESKRST
jgi:DNA-binding transcriptional MerR regulator